MPEEIKKDPPGVSDITPGTKTPDMSELQKQLAALQEEQKGWQTKEGQYIAALNRIAERLPEEEPSPAPKDEDFDEATNKILERRVSERLTPLLEEQQATRDMLDQMMFMQHAAAMGATPAQVGEAEQQYQGWQASGLRTVSKDNRGRRVERIPTRKEALAFVLGNSTMGGMLKEAPTKSMQALRAQLLGNAAFEAPGGRAPARPDFGLNYEEVEAKPLNERIKAREEALDKVGF